MPEEIAIPMTVVKLIVGHLTGTNTEIENDQLDDWINRSEQNLEVFEECVNVAFRPTQPDPDTSEFEHALYGIVELFIKKLKGQLTTEEQQVLSDWAAESPFRLQLLEELPKTDDMETVYRWLLKQWLEKTAKSKLN